MSKRAITAFALPAMLLVLLLSPSAAWAQTASDPSATSSLLVKLVSGLSVDEQAAVIARNGGVEISSIPALRLHVVVVSTADQATILAAYQADPLVQSAEVNTTRQSETVPADPLYAYQWALPRIGWEQVFDTITPAGSARVALLDTGVDASHSELAGTVVPGISMLDSSDGRTDPSGHGTSLAGIIAAATDNIPMEGIAGVAYAGVQIMPVTVLDANGEGQDSDVIRGVLGAADHGADVILMAFSAPQFSQNLQDAIDYAWSKGVVVVAAAGNSREQNRDDKCQRSLHHSERPGQYAGTGRLHDGHDPGVTVRVPDAVGLHRIGHRHSVHDPELRSRPCVHAAVHHHPPVRRREDGRRLRDVLRCRDGDRSSLSVGEGWSRRRGDESSYTLPSVVTADAGTYTVVVMNSCGSATSSELRRQG